MLKSLRRLVSLVALLPSLAFAQDAPWRLHGAIGGADWLTIEGTHRFRYEHLDNTYRIIDPGQDEILVSRLRLHLRASGETFYAGFELQDSRGWLHGDLTPVGTDDINVLEPLRAYIGYRTATFDLTLGRMIWDMGSRRLLSRNRFRNVTNIFTGIRATWARPGSYTLRSWLTMPANALPNNLERDRLRGNEFELDQERKDYVFWGVNLYDWAFANGFTSEWYVLGLKEEDRPSRPSRNRNITTVGTRLLHAGDGRAIELEAVYQFGTTRATILPTDLTDIDHRAWFVHAELEQGLDGPWDPSIILRFDYATGDDDPDDGDFNRFDPLFGDRRWEYGPTGIFGALTRSNLVSPGVALRLQPTASVDLHIDYRAAWLESDRDFMPTALLRDRDGNAGSFIGHQVDARWRWVPLPDNISVELGAAYLWKGEFLEQAPFAPPPDNTMYVYFATNLTF